MKPVWFRQTEWTCVPVHIAGYLITLVAIVCVVPVCTALANNGRSMMEELPVLFVFTYCTAFWWKGIAEKTRI